MVTRPHYSSFLGKRLLLLSLDISELNDFIQGCIYNKYVYLYNSFIYKVTLLSMKVLFDSTDL